MLIVVIVSGILIGWIVGNWCVDRWINTNSEDINNSSTEENTEN